MYLGTAIATDTENDGKTIIESTSEDTTPDKRFGGYRDGVQLRADFDLDTSAFKRMGGHHIYMGARRLRGLTDEERTGIAAWALERERERIPYAYVGGTFFSSGTGGLSCVGLTEKAYESVGRNIVPTLLEIPLLPVRQFALTEPVTEITIEEGETFVMDVYGVVARAAGGYEKAIAPDYDIEIEATENSPAATVLREQRAKFVSSQFLTFKPNEHDSDLSFVFRFSIKDLKSGARKRTVSFLIHVEAKPKSVTFVRQDPPTIQVGSASFAGDLVVTNNSAYVSVSGGQARLQWNEPPQQLSPGQEFTITINADANSAPAQTQLSSTSPASPRSLFADVNRFVSNFADDAAFIGYVDRIEPCNGRCYKLGHRSITRTITAGQEEFTVTISLASYGGLTYGGSGERKGSVTWRYVKK